MSPLLDLDVRDLRLVAAVARHGTLTKAGEFLHISQSGLSHQLADLEGRIGAPVFARLGRRMVPTPVGERLLAAGADVLSAMERAQDEVRSAVADRVAMLRLSTECYTCYHWLPPLLRRFEQAFPQVETRIVAEATRRPVEALLEGSLDLAITSCPPDDRRVRSRRILRDELVAIVAPDHPWAGRRYVKPDAFADQHVITYDVQPAQSTFFQEFLLPAGVTPDRVSHIQLTEAILEMVKAGLGVTVHARWAVAPQLADGSLVAVRLGSRGLHRTWCAATRRQKHDPAWLTGFVDLLASTVMPGAQAPRPLRAVG